MKYVYILIQRYLPEGDCIYGACKTMERAQKEQDALLDGETNGYGEPIEVEIESILMLD